MKTLLVHEHMLYRVGLRHLMRQVGADLTFIEATNFDQMLNLSDMHSDLSLVLLSLDQFDAQGVDALKQLSGRHPSLPVVVLCDDQDHFNIDHFVDSGARGVITETSDRIALCRVLSAILAGDMGPPRRRQALPRGFRPPKLTANIEPANDPMPADRMAADSDDIDDHYLTPRQIEVLALIKRGKSNKEIARDLELSVATVKTYCLAIFRELNVNNRTQAALKADTLTVGSATSAVSENDKRPTNLPLYRQFIDVPLPASGPLRQHSV